MRRHRPLTRGRAIVAGLAVAMVVAGCGGPPNSRPTPKPPREVVVTVLDRTSHAGVAGARLQVGQATATTGSDGRVVLLVVRGARVGAKADGYDAGSASVPDHGGLTIALRPNVASGTVTDSFGRPVASVRVFAEGTGLATFSDAAGRYRLPGVPDRGNLIFKMPGFGLGIIPIDAQLARDIALSPFEARALYAPSAIFESTGRLSAILDLIDRTEANAMVIDVKEASGKLYWATDLPAAVGAGTRMQDPLLQLDQVLPRLKQRGIYLIARMVVMKDNSLGS